MALRSPGSARSIHAGGADAPVICLSDPAGPALSTEIHAGDTLMEIYFRRRDGALHFRRRRGGVGGLAPLAVWTNRATDPRRGVRRSRHLRGGVAFHDGDRRIRRGGRDFRDRRGDPRAQSHLALRHNPESC